MTDSEKMDLILKKLDNFETKFDNLETRFDGLETKVDNLETRFDNLDNKVSGINLHLENVTDKNISILAENHLNLIDKLNQTVRSADKDLLNEIKMNVLTEKVGILEKEIADIKSKIA